MDTLADLSVKRWSPSDIAAFLATPAAGNPSTWYWHRNENGDEEYQPELITNADGTPSSSHWLKQFGVSVLQGDSDVGFFYIRLSDVSRTQGMGNSEGGPVLELVNFDVAASSPPESRSEIRRLLCTELVKVIRENGNPAIVPACHKSLDHLLGVDS